MQVTFLVRLVFVTFKVFNKRMKFEKSFKNASRSRALRYALSTLRLQRSVIEEQDRMEDTGISFLIKSSMLNGQLFPE